MSDPKRPRLDNSRSDYPGLRVDEQSQDANPVPNDTRRRSSSSRNTGRRRFECSYAGCGRNYSRAEHLYRHQLNHNPKEIYKCDFPGCSRTFVRQDLCIRHRERHDNHEKRRNSVAHQQRPGQETLSPPNSDGAASSPTSPAVNHSAILPAVPGGTQAQVLVRTSSLPQSIWETSALQAVVDRNVSGTKSTDDLGGAYSVGRGHVQHGFHDKSQSFIPPSIPTQKDPSSGLSRLPTSGLDTLYDTMSPPNLSRTRTYSNTQATEETPASRYPLPTLIDQALNDSPLSVRDEFAAWLFEDTGPFQPTTFSLGAQGGIGLIPGGSDLGSTVYPEQLVDPGLDTPYLILPQASESTNRSAEPSPDSALLSSSKRKSLIALMEYRFNEGDNPAIRQLREEVFRGNLDTEDHVLSIRSMQDYIGSYWYHFHAQMPILHQPTFSADGIHEYLLLAVMTIGAAFLNKAHGRAATDAAARLATFIAWHLRWQIFMHSDFHPPAKLWVLQTLLQLEIYEKMNASRLLHERSHIHYTTTINLMRRGPALVDTANQNPPHTPSTPEEWWKRWITVEATRRAAYAAFYLDAVHATMFGHAAMMVVHEIRLPLPCDDALWLATSAAEVGRVEASLHANGIKPTMFLDGLKKTLTGRKVRTNTFGRMILMAGLLSVSWHMNQRDLQISSLGVSQTMGIPDGWRVPLHKAFDFWKKDFDENFEYMRRAALPWQKSDRVSGEADVASMADCMYHLSRMAMNVDIFDCQIFAGIKRLFGKLVTDAEYERVRCKLFDWSKGSSSRVAVYHALQLLQSVLLSSKDGSTKMYSAREDYLMMRPWSL